MDSDLSVEATGSHKTSSRPDKPLKGRVLRMCGSRVQGRVEEDLAVREPFENVPFTVYGVLSPDLDTQAVRIHVPEEFPTLGMSEGLDADVSSTDLETSIRRACQRLLVGTYRPHALGEGIRVALLGVMVVCC